MDTEDEFEMECAALEAIFDDLFRQETDREISIAVSPVTPDGELLVDWVFTLKMQFPKTYPDEAPVFTLTSLENTMYSSEAKRQLQQALEVESASMIGDQMVFPLTEWLKDNLPQYVEISKQELRRDETDVTRSAPAPVPETKQVSKDKMTKAQKRRFYSRFGAVDEKPRGWNWVDVISHLSSRPQVSRD